MLQKSTFDFLKSLKKKNTRDWFQANRAMYDAAKVDFENYLKEAIDDISKFDKSIKGIEADNKPEDGRNQYYLVGQFDKLYAGKLSKLPG